MGQKLGLYAQGDITGGGSFTIDTTNAWHFLNTISPDVGSSYGLSLNSGESQAITVYADAGGGEVTVTSAGHGLAAGDWISITGTTNYNDVYEVESVSGNTFNITAAWAGDDATGTYHRGTAGCVDAGGGGVYLYIWTISCTAGTANTTFDFSVFVNGTPTTAIKRKFSTSTDVGVMAGVRIVELNEGDCLSFGMRNITNTGDITINNGTWSMIKVN